MKLFLFTIIFSTCAVQAASILGKHSCVGTADVMLDHTPDQSFSSQCNDLSIQIELKKSSLLISNHYSGCGEGRSSFSDRRMNVKEGIVRQGSIPVGSYSPNGNMLFWTEGNPGSNGFKTFLVALRSGQLIYEDTLYYENQIIKHQGICSQN